MSTDYNLECMRQIVVRTVNATPDVFAGRPVSCLSAEAGFIKTLGLEYDFGCAAFGRATQFHQSKGHIAVRTDFFLGTAMEATSSGYDWYLAQFPDGQVDCTVGAVESRMFTLRGLRIFIALLGGPPGAIPSIRDQTIYDSELVRAFCKDTGRPVDDCGIIPSKCIEQFRAAMRFHQYNAHIILLPGDAVRDDSFQEYIQITPQGQRWFAAQI